MEGENRSVIVTSRYYMEGENRSVIVTSRKIDWSCRRSADDAVLGREPPILCLSQSA